MAKVGYRPSLLPPRGRQLERSYRPCLTWSAVCLSLTILIFVVFGLTAYNIYFHRFGLTEHHYHAGDEVSLLRSGKDLTSIFCSAYQVQPRQQADFYLLASEAALDVHDRVEKNFSFTAEPRHFIFKERVHYLNEGSNVDLTACRNLPQNVEPNVESEEDMKAELVVIIGDDHFKEWTKSMNMRHERYRIPIPLNATCGGNVSLPHLNFDIVYADNYYFVLVLRHFVSRFLRFDDNIDRGNVTMMGKLNETRLNVSEPISVCLHNESVCDFPTPWNSQRDVVALVLWDEDNTNHQALFTTDCEERLAFWIPVFAITPVVLVTVASLWCWCLLVKNRHISAHYNASTIANTSYGAVREESAPLLAEAPPPTSNAHREEELCGASIQDYDMEDH